MLFRSFFTLMVVSSVLVALVSYRFVFLDLSIAFAGMSTHIANSLNAFLMHIIAAPIALILGALQFLPFVQKRRPFHRWMGRLYGLCVLVASISGFYIAIGAVGGPVASVGFAALACAWFATTAIGVAHARAKRFEQHRRWMIRSFALAFAGVTLRMQIPGFVAFGLDYSAASIYLAWTCWLPNIAFTQWWLSRQLGRDD